MLQGVDGEIPSSEVPRVRVASYLCCDQSKANQKSGSQRDWQKNLYKRSLTKGVALAGAAAASEFPSAHEKCLFSVRDLDRCRDESVFGCFTISSRESKGRSLACNWQAKFMNLQAFFFKQNT